MKRIVTMILLVVILSLFFLVSCQETNNVTTKNENAVDIHPFMLKFSKSEYFDVLTYKYDRSFFYSWEELNFFDNILNEVLSEFVLTGEEVETYSGAESVLTKGDEVIGFRTSFYNDSVSNIDDAITWLDLNFEDDFSQLKKREPKMIVVDNITYCVWECRDIYIILVGIIAFDNFNPDSYCFIEKVNK